MYCKRTCLNGCQHAAGQGIQIRCNAAGLWEIPQPLIDAGQVRGCRSFVPGPRTVYRKKNGFYESGEEHTTRLAEYVQNGSHNVPWGVGARNIRDARWVLRKKIEGEYNCWSSNPNKRGMRREGVCKGPGWWGMTINKIREALLIDALHRPITPDGKLAVQGQYVEKLGIKKTPPMQLSFSL